MPAPGVGAPVVSGPWPPVVGAGGPPVRHVPADGCAGAVGGCVPVPALPWPPAPCPGACPPGVFGVVVLPEPPPGAGVWLLWCGGCVPGLCWPVCVFAVSPDPGAPWLTAPGAGDDPPWCCAPALRPCPPAALPREGRPPGGGGCVPAIVALYRYHADRPRRRRVPVRRRRWVRARSGRPQRERDALRAQNHLWGGGC